MQIGTCAVAVKRVTSKVTGADLVLADIEKEKRRMRFTKLSVAQEILLAKH